MLHRLVVENLKAFGARQEVDLAPITLIYGPNSGGKSTLIQSLLRYTGQVVVSSFDGVAAVPEPASIVQAAIGFSAVGACARGRRGRSIA